LTTNTGPREVVNWFGAWPIALEGSDPAPIRRSLQWLREGGAVVIFPEGGRATPEGGLERFKAGAVRLALEANVPILPVTIKGGNRIWPRDQKYPRLFRRIEVIYHPLLPVDTSKDRDVLEARTEQLKRIIKDGSGKRELTQVSAAERSAREPASS